MPDVPITVCCPIPAVVGTLKLVVNAPAALVIAVATGADIPWNVRLTGEFGVNALPATCTRVPTGPVFGVRVRAVVW